MRLSTRTIGPHSYEHTHKANTRATRGLKAQEREFHTRMAFGMHTRARTRTHPEDTTRREELTATPEASLMRDGYEPALTGKYPR